MPATPGVIALVLAAGSSQRFGSDKRRACLADGRPLLVATLQLALRNFADVALVLRPEDDPLALGVPAGVQVIRSTEAELGMGHSLAAGVSALVGTRSRAIAVLLGDMPWLAEASLQQLIGAADAERIVFPLYGGERGHPVLFGRRYWHELCALRGDRGAKAVLAAHQTAWLGIELDDPGVLRDADTPQALL